MGNDQDEVIVMFPFYGDLIKEIDISGIKFELRIVTRTWVEVSNGMERFGLDMVECFQTGGIKEGRTK